MYEKLIRQLTEYEPYNEQEKADLAVIIDALRNRADIFERTNMTCHMTASAWVMNEQGTRVLMAYHNIYKSWSWLGGHADGETDLLSVALREVREESGIRYVSPVTEDIFSVEVLTVDGHEKKGVYVPSHLHLNVTYLLKADDTEQVRKKDDENSAVAWFAPDEAVSASSEPWFRERIYTKLNEKMRRIV
ncbi:MAG: NUDIX hydrolase [Clostridia bacterium]|nr:NUDIX hydrolase [Clostridia bacterium]